MLFLLCIYHFNDDLNALKCMIRVYYTIWPCIFCSMFIFSVHKMEQNWTNCIYIHIMYESMHIDQQANSHLLFECSNCHFIYSHTLCLGWNCVRSHKIIYMLFIVAMFVAIIICNIVNSKMLSHFIEWECTTRLVDSEKITYAKQN